MVSAKLRIPAAKGAHFLKQIIKKPNDTTCVKRATNVYTNYMPTSPDSKN